MAQSVSQFPSVTAAGSDLVPLTRLSTTVVYTDTTISAAASDNSLNDSADQFVAEGFEVGQRINIAGFTGDTDNNFHSAEILSVTAGKIVLGADTVLVDDAAGESVTITAWESVRGTAQGVADLAPAGTTDAAHTADTQAWQSKKYLMRDGQWRDPLVLGSGVLTVGSITTVTDDTKYNSWPQACRLRDGRIMIAYHKGDSHNLDNLGRSVGKIATENLDGTLTWGSEFEIYDHASLVAAPYGVAQISTGRIFVSIQQYDIAVSSYSAIIVYSDDDGATWSAPIDLTPTSGLTVGALCSGRVVEMRDGSLRQLVEGSASSLATRSTRIMSSTDGGLTWGSPVYVHNYATDSVIAVEPDLLLLDDDSLLAIWRTSGSPSTHAAARSTDGGATWGAKFNIFQGWGAPRMIQASTGTLFATTRRFSGAASVVFASLDRGATWDAGTTVDDTMYEQEYSALVEMRDGRILTVYGYQPAAPYTNSDIKCAPLTETKVKAGLITIPIACGDESTAATTGTAKVTFRMPCGMLLKPGGAGVRANAKTAPTGAALVIDINEDTGGGATSILSTKLSIDAGEKTSVSAAAPAVISDRILADDSEITIDFDQVGSTVAGAGIKVSLIGWELA
jgi:hypothetical protein